MFSFAPKVLLQEDTCEGAMSGTTVANIVNSTTYPHLQLFKDWPWSFEDFKFTYPIFLVYSIVLVL